GAVDVAGNVVMNDGVTMSGDITMNGNVAMRDNLNVGADGSGSLTVTDTVFVGGDITSSGNVVVGNSLQLQPGEGRGLHFGTGSDTGRMQFKSNGLLNGSDLEIRVSDDTTDRIVLSAPGGVRLPVRNTAPAVCNADNVGLAYYDDSIVINDVLNFRVGGICVCRRVLTVYGWTTTDNSTVCD
ncbi:MAG: hypothetical protein AAFX99_18705, partial [Myxococcota bacterium]